MEVYRKSSWLFLLLGVSLLSTALQGVQGEVESEGPSESECRPYIEKALKELETGEGGEVETPTETGGSSIEDFLAVDIKDDSDNQSVDEGEDDHKVSAETADNESVEGAPVSDQEGDTQEEQSVEQSETVHSEEENKEVETSQEGATEEAASTETVEEQAAPEETSTETTEQQTESVEETQTAESVEENTAEEASSVEEPQADEAPAASTEEATEDGNVEEQTETVEETEEQKEASAEQIETTETEEQTESVEEVPIAAESGETEDAQQGSTEEPATAESVEEPQTAESVEDTQTTEESVEEPQAGEESVEEVQGAESVEETQTAESVEEPQAGEESVEEVQGAESVEETQTVEESVEQAETVAESVEETTEPAAESVEEVQADAPAESAEEPAAAEEETTKSDEQTEAVSVEEQPAEEAKSEESEGNVMEELAEKAEEEVIASEEKESSESAEPVPEEDLILDIEIPENLRDRQHVEHLLKLDEESSDTENIINKISEVTLRELKKLYENAIKPLEVLYKYRDLSNRHFGDAEIFSKPLILFMGPWSGGKSSIINYLTNNEYNETSLRTGAEPSPAYFNLLMYGDEPEVIDGTELAADFTFSGLQKFGQGLEERLRGVKLKNKLLEKVNIVEIPGILEVRKQVSRLFPFNDACQWFIDRADIIFLVYDPSKLDVGPETEAILDQLKGREHQTRIILNKADQVKPEELMRVQGALIWNISPLMSSPQPPVMYTTSLWSRPYETWAPMRLLQAQERAFLRDLRGAIDKRIENKIASARRFAVRVRNHAKMVDCYLTTYYNHKSVFGNRKQVADEIIEHPQDYHIYEGLSTLTNISRYDLPDPEVYKDFFKLNPLYEFQQLSATCTYFRGCPINRLDVAIAYDLPELVGTHRRLVENALADANLASAPPAS